MFTLNLLDINSMIRTFVMFVIIDLLIIFHLQFVGMLIIYLHKKFHTPSFNDSLGIAIGLKDR